MTAEVRVSAPAKINLHLGVGPVEEDGYHPLVTVFQAVDLYDELTLRESPRTSLTVSGDGVEVAGVPRDESNLVLRAVRALAEHHARDDLTAAMHLRKRIPVAGGLAGGSADAAAALLGLDSLYELRTGRLVLSRIAAGLGSDVPFCLHGGTALGTGRGEQLAPLMTRGDYWWVLVPDASGLSTREIYEIYDGIHGALSLPAPEPPTGMTAALRVGDVEQVGAQLYNDLQAAVLSVRPDLDDVVQAGRDAGAYGALVSGSGPTVALLCGDADHAAYVDDQVQRDLGRGPNLVTKGPGHGAKVVGARTGGLYQ
jgi:4-diphosphocytidyl-2-C-methyl-D-erythritol kinase